MSTTILGIDPGAHTGLATFQDGKLLSLDTIKSWQIQTVLAELKPARVIFEDSRLQSRAWTARTKASKGAAIATGRDLGQVDCVCGQIVGICEELGIPAHGISPAAKGPKRDAANFKALTGWDKRSNQHERDAAMVAWTFRGAAKRRAAAC